MALGSGTLGSTKLGSGYGVPSEAEPPGPIAPPVIEIEPEGPGPGPEEELAVLSVAKPADKRAVVGAPIVAWNVVASHATHFAAAGLPAGIVINAGTGVVSGTATAIAGAEQAFLVTVTVEGLGETKTTTFTYVVAALAVVNPGEQHGTIGSPVSLDISAPLATSFTAEHLPPGTTIDPKTGHISGTLTEVGEVSTTVTAHNATEVASVTFHWVTTAVGFQLSALAREWIEGLPPILRDSRHYQAVIQSLAKECERADAAIETVRRQFNPARADVLLSAWEQITRQPIEPSSLTLAERRVAVIAHLRKMLTIGEGSEWVLQVAALVGPGWSYEEHNPANPASPAPNVLRIQLPWPPTNSRYAEAQRQIREITPAHLQLEYGAPAGSGFVLDVSELDVDEMGI